jgi:hypothetical protein
MPEVKSRLKRLAQLFDTVGLVSFGGASYLAPGPAERAISIALTGVVGINDGFKIGKIVVDKYNKYTLGAHALLGTASLGISISDILSGKLEKLPYDLSWTVGNYSRALGETLHYLARK